VEAALFDLAAGWRAQGFPDADIYTTLSVVVLPTRRQDDVFLYSRPLSDGVLGEPRSGARLLVEAAVRARKLDDLRARARVRQKNPATLLPARVLLALACLAGDDAAGVSEQLAWLGQRLRTDKSPASAELACHVALPALRNKKLAPTARPVLDQATAIFQAAHSIELTTGLAILSARALFDQGRREEANEKLKDAVIALLNDEGQIADQLLRLGHEFIRAGQTSEALQLLGFVALAPNLSTQQLYPAMINGLYASFARHLASHPAPERYALLRSWTLPGSQRPEVRLGRTTRRPGERGGPPGSDQRRKCSDPALARANRARRGRQDRG
jgi:hypothetical protein